MIILPNLTTTSLINFLLEVGRTYFYTQNMYVSLSTSSTIIATIVSSQYPGFRSFCDTGQQIKSHYHIVSCVFVVESFITIQYEDIPSLLAILCNNHNHNCGQLWTTTVDHNCGPQLWTTDCERQLWATDIGPQLWTTDIGRQLWTTDCGPQTADCRFNWHLVCSPTVCSLH